MIPTASLKLIPYEHFWELKLSKNFRVNFTALLNVSIKYNVSGYTLYTYISFLVMVGFYMHR